jgi:ubiquinone/menaquinone biosynthesis C-methylase UbiE
MANKTIAKIYAFIHRLFARPEERGEYSSGYWQDMVRQKTLAVCRGLSGKLLEVGCGEGLFLAQLSGQNPNLEIWGVDCDAIILEKARKRFQERNLKNINLSPQDGVSLSFSNEYFDVVVCINVFLDLGSKEIIKNVLREIARVCKRGATVIVDFRNSANPLIPLKYKFAPLYDPTIKHLLLKAYRLEEMRLILEEVGLLITNTVYAGFPIKRIAPVIILKTEKV